MAVFIAAALSYPHLNDNLSAPDYSVTGSDSAEVAKIVGSEFTAAGAEQDVIVFDSDTLLVTDPEYQAAVSDVLNSIQGQPGVVAVTSPYDPLVAGKQFSSDMTAAFATLGLNGDDRERATRSADLEDLVGGRRRLDRGRRVPDGILAVVQRPHRGGERRRRAGRVHRRPHRPDRAHPRPGRRHRRHHPADPSPWST